MKYLRLTVLTLLTSALLAACGGGTGTPPANPQNFTATAASSTSIKLDWSKVNNATSYTLERKTGTGAYAEIAKPAANITTYTDTGLTPNTEYSYRIRAKNAVGSSTGKEASAKTQATGGGGNFTLALDPGSRSVAQGGTTTVTVNVERTGGFTGPVTVTLADPPSGVSADALTIPSGETSGTLTLRAAANATIGSTPVTVRGTSGDLTANATLTLDVTAAAGGDDFTIALSNPNLTITPGGNAQTTVNISRSGGFSGPVTLALEGANVGAGANQISGTFAPSPATGGSSTLTVSVGEEVATGEYNLTVRGTGGNTNRPVSLKVTVAQAEVLLVDDDASSNNDNPSNSDVDPSGADTVFQTVLDNLGVNYDVIVVPSNQNGPSFDTIKDYKTVIWYTAASYGGAGNEGTISGIDEFVIQGFLDQGLRKAIVVTEEHIYGLGSAVSWTSTTNDFLSQYVGLIGGEQEVIVNQSFTVTGVPGTVTEGMRLNVGTAPTFVYTAALNPAEGTDTLLTIQADPDRSGPEPVGTVATATGNKNVGTAGTSTMIYLGFAYENIADISTNNKQSLMDALLEY